MNRENARPDYCWLAAQAAKTAAVTLTDVLGLVTVMIGNILGGLVIRLILKVVASNQV